MVYLFWEGAILMGDYFEYGEQEISYLKKKDKKLAVAIDRIGMIKRAINPDVFSALVESIVGQQISSKAAATVCKKLYGLSHMQPGILHGLSQEEIQACGMTNRKAGYIKGMAKHYVEETIDFQGLKDKPDAEIIKTLTQIDGIGVWTVEMLLIFSLQRPDVVSFGDLAIRRGMMNLYGHREIKKERFRKYAKRYSPFGSVASLYLWELSNLKE